MDIKHTTYKVYACKHKYVQFPSDCLLYTHGSHSMHVITYHTGRYHVHNQYIIMEKARHVIWLLCNLIHCGRFTFVMPTLSARVYAVCLTHFPNVDRWAGGRFVSVLFL